MNPFRYISEAKEIAANVLPNVQAEVGTFIMGLGDSVVGYSGICAVNQ